MKRLFWIALVLIVSESWAQPYHRTPGAPPLYGPVDSLGAPQVTPKGFMAYDKTSFMVRFKNNTNPNIVKVSDGSFYIASPAPVQTLVEKWGVKNMVSTGRVTGRWYIVALDSTYYDNEQWMEDAIEDFKSNSKIETAHRIGIHLTQQAANDTLYDGSPFHLFPRDHWSYNKTLGDTAAVGIEADSAWTRASGDSNVVIMVADTGVRYYHKELDGRGIPWSPTGEILTAYDGGNIWINPNEVVGDSLDNDGNGLVDDIVGYDFVFNLWLSWGDVPEFDSDLVDNDPDDYNGHGTHVAGTIAATTHDQTLLSGVAGGRNGNGCEIVCMKVGWEGRLGGWRFGLISMTWAGQAFEYAVELKKAGVPIKAINCSWSNGPDPYLMEMADSVIANDIIIVQAAGNENRDLKNANNRYALVNRAKTDSLIVVVAATDSNGVKAVFSNFESGAGPGVFDYVRVAAPGVTITSSWVVSDTDFQVTPSSNRYVTAISGTSMAAPHVAGIIGLAYAYNPNLTAKQVVRALFDPDNHNPKPTTNSTIPNIISAKKVLDALAP